MSLAKRINAERNKRKRGESRKPALGKVFAYRYHATPIRTPRYYRNALTYVLKNWRHHQRSASACDQLDPFATGSAFSG